MNKNVLLWLIVIGCSLGVSMGVMVDENENSTSVLVAQGTKKLSRHKRYLAFPEGSSFSVSKINAGLFAFNFRFLNYVLSLKCCFATRKV